MKTKKAANKGSRSPGPRVRSVPKHRSFRITKKRLKQYQPVPGVIALFRQTFGIIKRNKRIFLGVAAINAVVSYIFIQGLGSSFNLTEIKTEFEGLLGGGVEGKLSTGFALFGYLLGTAGASANESSGSYQLVLTIITSLAVVWLVRQVMAGERPDLRDGFYKGMYPLVPFMLLLLVICFQFVPLLIGNLMFTTVIQNGLASSAIETILWLLLFILLALLSLYMVISSLFSLYIVMLPDVRPLQALRSARELVLHRRFSVGLRILALPLILTVIGALIFVPMLIFLTAFTQPIFLLLSSLSLVIAHIYLYVLYRALI